MAEKRAYERRDQVLFLPMKMILEPSYIMRATINEKGIEELAGSIRKVGLIEPIVVKKSKTKYEIIAGHRRYLAHILLKAESIPAIVRYKKEEDINLVKLHENIYREDITVGDEARLYGYLLRSLGMSQKEIAAFASKSEGYVSQRVAILNYPQPLMEKLESGDISFAVARELSKIDDIKTLTSLIYAAATGGCSESTAKMWRQQFEATKTPLILPEEDGQQYDNKMPEQKVEFLCEGCRHHFTFSELKPVYFCHDCLSALKST
jgi:ParB/RepB/Spo0J family partition protein